LALDYPHLGKFDHAAHEFAVYIRSNAASLINYGERYRNGERIASCLAESSVNAVISKRFAKRQQMQRSRRGAHLLLLVDANEGTLSQDGIVQRVWGAATAARGKTCAARSAACAIRSSPTRPIRRTFSVCTAVVSG
jgi:hypothetical protein